MRSLCRDVDGLWVGLAQAGLYPLEDGDVAGLTLQRPPPSAPGWGRVKKLHGCQLALGSGQYQMAETRTTDDLEGKLRVRIARAVATRAWATVKLDAGDTTLDTMPQSLYQSNLGLCVGETPEPRQEEILPSASRVALQRIGR